MIEIRHATTSDVPSLVACHLACWREAYQEVAPADYLAELDQSIPARIAFWTSKIAKGNAPWLAVDDETVIGLAAAGPTEDDDLPSGLELFAIYVRATHWDSGLGHRLLEAAIGNAPASLWALEDNPRAHRFYRRHGFTPDGTAKHHGRLDLPIIRLTR